MIQRIFYLESYRLRTLQLLFGACESYFFPLIIRGLSIHLFSFINEVDFLVSKGLFYLYNEHNNTWLLEDMEFLFSCPIRELLKT